MTERRLCAFLFACACGAASMAAPAQGQTVPVRMIDGLPVVSVTLGAVTADFLLDTGAATAITVPKPFFIRLVVAAESSTSSAALPLAVKRTTAPRLS